MDIVTLAAARKSGGSGGGASITVDSELSLTSENPVQNKVITVALANISNWITDAPEMHRNIFRGQNLGTAVTAAQLAAIADGSFDDLFVGDYWTSSETINGETVTVKWRIADMDYFYQKGKWADQNVMVHHIIVLPDVALRNAVYGTDFTADNAMVDAVFQNHRLTAYFSNDSSTWTGFTTHHLNSYMLFGYDRTDAPSPYKYPVMDQLSLFRIAPEFMTPYYEENSNLFSSQWIMRNNNYPRITVRGTIFSDNSSAVGGFRPWFVIGTDNANNG